MPESDNKDQVVLPSELFQINANGLVFNGIGEQFLKRIQNCRQQDEAVIKALKELGSASDLHQKEWRQHNGLVLF